MPANSAGQVTECGRCRIDLVVMGAVRERAQLIDKGFVPGTLDQLTKPRSHCARNGSARHVRLCPSDGANYHKRESAWHTFIKKRVGFWVNGLQVLGNDPPSQKGAIATY